MKNLTLLLILFATISCKSQTILNITQNNGRQNLNDYYKDIDHILDPFEGTYLYTNGTTSFKVVLEKKEMSNAGGVYYEDMIIGEYQYIENGVEKFNSLSRLAESFTDQRLHYIRTRAIIGPFLCSDCNSTEVHLVGHLVDNISERSGKLRIRKIIHEGQVAIRLGFYWSTTTGVSGQPEPPEPCMPGGEYILIKQ